MPDEPLAVPGTGAFRLLIILGIAALLCSSTWMVLNQYNRGQVSPEKSSGDNSFETKGNAPAQYPASDHTTQHQKPFDKHSDGTGTKSQAPDPVASGLTEVPIDSLRQMSLAAKTTQMDSLTVKPAAKDSVQVKRKKHLSW